MNPHIFRQYDIRGLVGPDLDASVAYTLGRAFGTLLRREGPNRPRAVLGRDNRLSSDELAQGFREGLNAAGVDVLDVGTVPTPVLYFAAATLESDGGVQITGSHNPPQYNGFKLSIGGRSIYGERIQELRRIIDNEAFEVGEGSWEER